MNYTQFERLPDSPAPRPFPGKYPTRIRVEARRGNVPLSYVGKPVTALRDFVGRHYFRKGGILDDLRITEFDQNGIVRRFDGGTLVRACTFADIYFPIPADLLSFLSNRGRLFMFLDRELVSVDERFIYCQTFWQGTAWSSTVKDMLRDVAHSRFRTWFPRETAVRMADHVDILCRKAWFLPVRSAVPALRLVTPRFRSRRHLETEPQPPAPEPQLLDETTGVIPRPVEYMELQQMRQVYYNMVV